MPASRSYDVALVEYVNVGGGRSTSSALRSVAVNTRSSVVGNAWGRMRSVIESRPAGTCGIRPRRLSAMSRARSNLVAEPAVSEASIDRDVSSKKNTWASTRSGTSRVVPITGWADATPRSSGTAATAATTGTTCLRVGASRPIDARIACARRERRAQIPRGRSTVSAKRPATGVRKVTSTAPSTRSPRDPPHPDDPARRPDRSPRRRRWRRRSPAGRARG